MITLKETTEHYNLGQNKTIQTADHGLPVLHVLLVTDLHASISFDQTKKNEITN